MCVAFTARRAIATKGQGGAAMTEQHPRRVFKTVPAKIAIARAPLLRAGIRRFYMSLRVPSWHAAPNYGTHDSAKTTTDTVTRTTTTTKSKT